MRLNIFVFEPTGDESRRHLVRVLGVDWVVTSFWPGLIVWTFAVGILGALEYAPAATGSRVVIGLGYGALTLAAVIAHSVGHILGGHAVGARMHTNLITSTVPVNLYHDEEVHPRRIHFARTVGGPLLNVVFGVLSLALARVATGGGFFGWFAAMNFAVGLLSLLPLPTLDGWFLLRLLFSGTRGAA